jgi:hypothetical protein
MLGSPECRKKFAQLSAAIVDTIESKYVQVCVEGR